MGATQTTLYIQGNYLDINKHRELLDMLQSKKCKIMLHEKTYGFETTTISLQKLKENEYEINQIINSLDPNAFIRISSNPSFTEYREYRTCKPR